MNQEIFIKNLMVGQSILKVRSLLPALMVAFLALGLGFIGLSLDSGLVQAAPAGQGQRWQITLPVTNTASQTSIYTVTNLTTQTLSIRHEFYAGGFPGGRFVAVLTDTHFLLERKIYALSRIPNFPSDFVGVVVITSNQPITGSAVTRAIATPTPVATPYTPGETKPLLPPLPLLYPERVEINWTLVAYLVVGIFAMSGFFKGWWKEAITTFFLGILIFFLAMPDAAEWFINTINDVIRFTWEQLSKLGIAILNNYFFQLDPSSGQTWLVILLLFIGLAIFISRAGLSGMAQGGRKYTLYVVTPIGSVLGTILGGLNGFLLITLVKHYLEESNLPGSGQLPTEIVMTGGNVITTSSSGPNILITGLLGFTWFNFLLPWFVIAFVVLTLLFIVGRRRQIPPGYSRHSYTIVKEKDQEKNISLIDNAYIFSRSSWSSWAYWSYWISKRG